MKSIKALLALAVFGIAAIGLQAQPAPKIFVVDMAKLYDDHYKTGEQKAKLEVAEKAAQDELDKLNNEGKILVDQYRELVEQAKGVMLTDDARQKIESDAQRKLEEIQRKQGEVEQFRGNAQRSLQQRVNNFRSGLLEDIAKVAVEVAKRKGGNLVIDRSGPSLLGMSPVLFADTAYDITVEVQSEIDKTRPAAGAAGAGLTVPGVTR